MKLLLFLAQMHDSCNPPSFLSKDKLLKTLLCRKSAYVMIAIATFISVKIVSRHSTTVPIPLVLHSEDNGSLAGQEDASRTRPAQALEDKGLSIPPCPHPRIVKLTFTCCPTKKKRKETDKRHRPDPARRPRPEAPRQAGGATPRRRPARARSALLRGVRAVLRGGRRVAGPLEDKGKCYPHC